jgi:excinuclease UvrABC ATPase subunit
MPSNVIKIRGARVHNLKNVDIDIPKNKLVVITGLSGSGKSSLAFDTLYAEGQRRYVESLSAYARQFLGVMQKPDVDKIEGISPAISIDQRKSTHNPRLVRLPKFTIISVCYSPESACLIVRNAVNQFLAKPLIKLPGRF